MIVEWAARYVGLPFRNRGRDREGLDCWGLVRLVLLEQFGLHLPSLSESYERADDNVVVSYLVDAQRAIIDASRVIEPQPGDIVLLKLRGLPCHVGLYVGNHCMLHAWRKTAVVVEDLSSLRWARRVEGYYRVR